MKARGWCRTHYLRWYKTGDPTTVRPGRWDGYERPTCSVIGCTAPAHARGLCTIHGPRQRRHGDPEAGRRRNATGSEIDRLLSFVEIPEDPDACWLWTGATTAAGYPEFTYQGVTVYAHRRAYELLVGPIPDGHHVDHTCHNADPACPGGNRCGHRRCINVRRHLEPVTVAENNRRARARTR